MNDMKLYEGINHIDDDLIDEAADSGRKPRYYTFALSAAAILLAVGLSGAAVGGKDLLSKFDPHSHVIISEETTSAETAVTTTHLSETGTDTSHPNTTVSGQGSASRITTVANGSSAVTASAVTDKVSVVTEKAAAVPVNSTAAFTRIPSAVNTIPLTDAAVTTVITEDIAPVTTKAVSTTSHSERRIIMKRQITSLITASILSSVTPTGLQAKQPVPEYTDYAKECFASVESGDIDLDVNGDGVFDTIDLYQTYLSCTFCQEDTSLSEEQYNKARELWDMYDGMNLPFDYYFYKNNVLDPDDFKAEKYTDSNGEVTLNSYRFLNYLHFRVTDDFGCLYDPADPDSNCLGPELIQKYYKEHIKNGDIDIDFNCDGKTDIYDLFTLCIFENTNTIPGIDSDKVYIEYELDLPEEMSKKCESFIRNYTFGLNAMDIDPRETFTSRGIDYSKELMKYFIYNTEFTTDYIDYHKYLERLDQLFGEYCNTYQSNNLRWFISSYIAPIKKEAIIAGVVSNNSKQEEFLNHEYSGDYYNSTMYDMLASYRKAMLAGEAPVPDIDGDGKLTWNDGQLLDDYIDDVKKGKDIFDSTMDPAMWSAVDQLDANCNGITGEWTDVAVASEFISNCIKDITSNYINDCINDFTSEVPCTELEKYLTEYEESYSKRDRYIYLYDANILYKEFPVYEKAVIAGETPVPDINGDGFLTEEDYDIVDTYYCIATATRGIILSETMDTEFLSNVDQIDVNGDGITGDWIDVETIMSFINRYTDEEHPCSDLEALKHRYYDIHKPDRFSNPPSAEDIAEEFAAYEKAVLTGELPVPDIDGDGILTGYGDWSVYDNYAENIINDTKKISPEFKLTIEKLDINNDGLKGDIIDIEIVKSFIQKYSDSHTPCTLDELIKKYNESLPAEKADEVITGQKPLTSESADIAGDANCDKKVTISDAVAVLQYVSNSEKYPLSSQGKKNADLDGAAGITGTDAITIQKIDAGII